MTTRIKIDVAAINQFVALVLGFACAALATLTVKAAWGAYVAWRALP